MRFGIQLKVTGRLHLVSLFSAILALSPATVSFAQPKWHATVDEAKSAIPNFHERLVIVAQFQTGMPSQLSSSFEFSRYSSNLSGSPELTEWLNTNAVLVAESINQVSTQAAVQTGASITFFCLPTGEVVNFLVGYPAGIQLLRTAKESMKMFGDTKDSDDISASIRNLHFSKLVPADARELESVLPTTDPRRIKKGKNKRRIQIGFARKQKGYSYEHILAAIKHVRHKSFVNRFGDGLKDNEIELMLNAIVDESMLGAEVVNMMMARLPHFELRRIDRLIWPTFVDQPVSRTPKKLDDFVFVAKQNREPIIFRVSDSAQFSKGEFGIWPSDTERHLNWKTRGFKTACCHFDDLTQITDLLDAQPVVISIDEKVEWFLSTHDGELTKVVMVDDETELVKAIKIIRKANK